MVYVFCFWHIPFLFRGKIWNLVPGYFLSLIALLPLSVPTSLIAICQLSAWCVLFNTNFEKLLVKRRRTAWKNLLVWRVGQCWQLLERAVWQQCMHRWMISSQGIANKTFLILRYSAGQQKLNELWIPGCSSKFNPQPTPRQQRRF